MNSINAAFKTEKEEMNEDNYDTPESVPEC